MLRDHSQDYDYIQRTYKVPAKQGARVKYQGKLGTITGADGSYIYIRLDGSVEASGPYHPTWEMEYL